MDNKNINNQNNQNKQTEQTDKNVDEFKEEIKKQGTEIGNTIKKFAMDTGMFLFILFIIICIILYVFISGGISVYLSKLGAANILPTNKEFFPYTNVTQTITPPSTPIFTNSKINFPYDTYNSSNYLLDGTRKYKDKLQTSFYLVYLIMTYFITIYENMVQFNYSAINLGLYLMNQIPNDTVILLFGPTMLTIVTFIISIINPIYFIFTWFTSLKTFFQFENNAAQLEANADFKGIWKSLNVILNIGLVPISIIIALWMALIMFVMFFFSTWWTFGVVSFIFFLVLWSCYFYAATINGVNVNLISTILGLLKLYKFSLMILISLIIILMSFLNFGILGIVTCSCVLLLIYLGAFNSLGLDMFLPTV
jgi:hypothetical protein